jgi:hypothetical protein
MEELMSDWINDALAEDIELLNRWDRLNRIWRPWEIQGTKCLRRHAVFAVKDRGVSWENRHCNWGNKPWVHWLRDPYGESYQTYATKEEAMQAIDEELRKEFNAILF